MNTYHVIGQATFANSQSRPVDVFVQASHGLAALGKVQADLNRDGELSDFDLHSLLLMGPALEEASS